MNKIQDPSVSSLRENAERIFTQKTAAVPDNAPPLSSEQTEELLHELQVHQIELEMQNEELRRSRQELEASQARYFDLYDLAPVGYCTISERGMIREANLTAGTMLGESRSALINQPLSRFIVREDRDPFYRYYRRLFATDSAGSALYGKPHACDMRMTKKDGTAFRAHLESTVAHNDDGAPVCRVVLNDVTEQRFQEDERDLTARLIVLVNTPGNFRECISSLTASLQNWSGCEAVGIRLHEGNDYPYFETRGFPADFIESEKNLCLYDETGKVVCDGNGNPILECMCGNVLCGRTDSSKPFFTSHGSFWSNNTTTLLAGTTAADRQSHTRNRCNGRGYQSVALIPLRSGDRVFGLLQFNDRRTNCFTLDQITHFERMADCLAIALSRRQAEESLKISELKLRAILDATPFPIALVDPKDTTIDFWSHSAYKLFGHTAPSVAEWYELAYPDPVYRREVIDRWKPFLEKARLSGKTVNTGEYRVTCRDGSVCICELFATFVAENLVVTFNDITERKRIEEEIRKIQKLESLGILAGGIAHDFNNLMCGIFGYIELANEHAGKGDSTTFLTKALGTIDRARSLTRQLLTFSQGGAPQLKATPLFPFVQDTALFALSGSNVSCTFDIAADLKPCNIDKNQICQAIENIIINAKQAMPNGGTIELKAVNTQLGDKEHAVLPPGNYARIAIKDSGTGIPEDILPRIFDPFYTTKTMGHGLGLTTGYSIIRQHHGAIDVASEPGKGSTFTVFLPVTEESVAEIAATPLVHRGSGTIIVMDDEEVMRDTLKEMLTPLGYTVRCTTNGKEALDLFIRECTVKSKVSALIFDLTVPGGMGGKSAVEELRKIDAEIPVFVASGYSDDPVLKNPKEFGFTASISKPFMKAELMEMLNRCLHKR